MKLLLDTCVWGRALESLRKAGHDVEWTGDWERDPGDQEILEYANKQGRVLVTLDKDFGERAIVFGEPHSGIVRLVGIAAREQADLLPCRFEKVRVRARAGRHHYRGFKSNAYSYVGLIDRAFTE